MKFIYLQAVAAALAFSTAAFATPLAPLTSANSSILVNNTSPLNPGVNGQNAGGNAANPGQLYSLTAFGYQVIDVGDAVKDSGAMLGTNTATFVSNYSAAAPSANFSTTSAANNGMGMITTSGVFSGVFGNVAWTKTYRFVQNDVLEEVYTVTNNGGTALSNFRGFTAYDADQYAGGPNPAATLAVGSTNSVGTLSGYNYASSAFAGLNVVLASNNASVVLGFLQNNFVTADCINALLGGGSSGSCNTGLVNGTIGDRAMAYAFNIANLGINQTQSFTVYQLYGNGGLNLTTALAALPGGTGSSSSGGGVPEPGSMLLMGSACVALGIVARRRAKQ